MLQQPAQPNSAAIPPITLPPGRKDWATKPMYLNPNTPQPPGLVQAGNIDLTTLPGTYNPPTLQSGASHSTVNSSSFTDEDPNSPTYGKEILVRGILPNGKRMEDEFGDDVSGRRRQGDWMRAEYKRTGKHLGVFATPEAADAYAQRLHEDWERNAIPGVANFPQ